MKKSQLIKIAIIVLVIASISVGLFFILKACGVTDIEYLRNLISSTGAWSWIIFILIRVICTIFLCFVPAVSMIFDLVSVALFGANWKAFVISLTSITICSMIMYSLGRFGANKFLEKIIGKEDLEKANKLIKEKGLVFYPVMMAVGGFPDDAIVCMAGTIKMNIAYFLPTTIIGRSIGCATTIFGLSLIPFSSFTRPYDWFVFICCVSVLLYFIIKGGNWISKKIENRGKNRGKSLNLIKPNESDLETTKKSCVQKNIKNTNLNLIKPTKQNPVTPTSKNKSPN